MMTKTLNVAMIGGGFMGKAHALAYAAMPMFFWPAPAIPVRKVVVDVTDELAEEGRRALRLRRKLQSDWRSVVSAARHRRRRHRHAERQPCRDRHRGGQRPASTSSAKSRSPARATRPRPMLDAVEKAGVIHMVAFNYRRTPAVALAQEIHRRGPHRKDPELPRHLSAGLVGRSGLAAVLALPEEDRGLRRDRRYRHPCRRSRALSCRRDRRGERAGPHLHQDAAGAAGRRSTSSAPPTKVPAAERGEVDVDDEIVTLLKFAGRRHRLARGHAQRLWPQQLPHLRDPRHEGIDRLQL